MSPLELSNADLISLQESPKSAHSQTQEWEGPDGLSDALHQALQAVHPGLLQRVESAEDPSAGVCPRRAPAFNCTPFGA